MKLNVKLAVAVLSFASITSTALATDRLVPSQYPTIQAAIDAAIMVASTCNPITGRNFCHTRRYPRCKTAKL